MTYDQILDSARILTAVIGLLAFIALVVTTWATIKANNEKEVRNKEQQERFDQLKNDTIKLNTELAEAKTKQAEAEARVLGLQKKLSWRVLDEIKFIDLIKSSEKGNVEIIYKKDDDEAYFLASSISDALKAVEWSVSTTTGKQEDSATPFPMREGGIMVGNESILTVSVAEETDAAVALTKALKACDFKPVLTVPHEAIRPPVGVIRVIIGSRL